jgi:hypothetical protein
MQVEPLEALQQSAFVLQWSPSFEHVACFDAQTGAPLSPEELQ